MDHTIDENTENTVSIMKSIKNYFLVKENIMYVWMLITLSQLIYFI